MRLKFWGAAQAVTGSMHIVETAAGKIALDCGLNQGRRKEAFELNRRFPCPPQELTAVVLSHAHIDHSGNLPTLVRQGFAGPIFATPATCDLCRVMLKDSAHIQESDVAHVNRQRIRDHKVPFEPLYRGEDVERTLGLFRPVPYGQQFAPLSGVSARFLDAGHILGSAMVVLDAEGVRLAFSGDLGRNQSAILRAPEIPDGVEALILESTYAGRDHDEVHGNRARLRQTVRRTVERGGKVLIPAFAVGRTQEVLHALNDLWDAGELPVVPVYLDSPLAIEATEVFRKHPECFNATTSEVARTSLDGDPLDFSAVRYLRRADESRALNGREESSIVIAASGMCESGRILHHLSHGLCDERNTVLFVGFQAQNTLGRKLMDGYRTVRVLGQELAVAAEVESLEGFSAHAGHQEILAWVAAVQRAGRLSRVFLVHGEEPAMESLRTDLERMGIAEVEAPKPEDERELAPHSPIMR